MNFGERVRQCREKVGLSQTKVADLMGYKDHSSIGRLEAESRVLPMNKLKQLADILETTPEYLLGRTPEPDCLQYAVLGDIAAGYEYPAVESWDGEVISIPADYITRSPSDYFVLQVKGSSMYPQYIDGDKVLMRKQNVLDYSGQVCAILYANEYATLKRVEFTPGDTVLKMIPINPEYEPRIIEGADLQLCHILGIPEVVVRRVQQ